MKKRYNLYYLFLEEKERLKMSHEKSAQIWLVIEAFFHAMKNSRPALPTQEREGKQQ